ncbi:winged helix-turn-helix domain-containing protein [Qipengyuania sp. YG27]|uniref:Winged helix-turn-helix domain-containing protein n=1 Tax=Qipengyuania mesophila TaxID=2867246 RepID=A0ABS7JRH1_9SPHN|nr:winged helix-turn-helix domain-containing protein [Qipengyuania mesophila]MBX7500206.1 winged helix-turn-helix domain-containing protein [Qipengyuania mesophila]
MPTNNQIAEVAALVGEPSRTSILLALIDGRALTASELAHAAGISPPTASEHLARLMDAELLAMEKQGRHRYFRLGSPKVASLLESMLSLVAERDATVSAIRTGPRDRDLRFARSCYDHLAGSLAVAIADRLETMEMIDLADDGGTVSEKGQAFFGDLGAELGAAGQQGRRYCRPCLDWSERRPHIAGRVGSGLMVCFLERGWVKRQTEGRVISVTRAGERAIVEHFGIDIVRLRERQDRA